ncbi:MAG: 5-bromo-4-chloroindolyl phosphate hydrolysis family protein [Oscillospiraceae bacterium]
MDKKRKKRHVSPIYTVAVIWIIYSFLYPPYTLGRLIPLLLLSVAGFVVAYLFVRGRDAKEPAEETEEAEEPKREKKEKKEEKTYPPQVQAIIDEGKTAQRELGRLYASIPNLEVKKKIRDIMEVSDKIIQDAIDDPSDVPQIKKFLDYYLPTTIKLLNAYDRMGAQGIEGENISGTMGSIEEMLDTAITAYKKLLDSLFADQAMDIETDIEVMNTLLKREGLSGSGAAGI